MRHTALLTLAGTLLIAGPAAAETVKPAATLTAGVKGLYTGTDGKAHVVTETDPFDGPSALRAATLRATGRPGSFARFGLEPDGDLAVGAAGGVQTTVLPPEGRLFDPGALRATTFGPGGTSPAAQTLSTDPVEATTVRTDVAADGSAVVAWVLAEDGAIKQVRFAVRAPGGPFGEPHAIAPALAGTSSTDLDLQVAAGPGGDAVVAAGSLLAQAAGEVQLVRAATPGPAQPVPAGKTALAAMGTEGSAAVLTQSLEQSGDGTYALQTAAPGTGALTEPVLHEGLDHPALPYDPSLAVAADGTPVVAQSAEHALLLFTGADLRRHRVAIDGGGSSPSVVTGPDGAVAVLAGAEGDKRPALAVAGGAGRPFRVVRSAKPITSGGDEPRATFTADGRLVVAAGFEGRGAREHTVLFTTR